MCVTPPPPRDALEGKGPQSRPQTRFDRGLEEVAKAVGVNCRLQMALKLPLASVRQWLGVGWAPWRGGGGGSRFPAICEVNM